MTFSIPVAYPSYLKLTENTFQNNMHFLDLKLFIKIITFKKTFMINKISFHLM